MIPEPLRGKQTFRGMHIPCFDREDVKSAIEGLKDEIKNTKELYIYPKAGRKILELINKWFDDVKK